jgi:signal peptidase I
MRKLTIILAVCGASVVGYLVLAMVALTVDAKGGSSFQNISPGMDPSLLPGDNFTVRPVTRARAAALERGSMVMHVFPPDRSKTMLKRIVGVPGDTLRMEHGTLIRNSRTVDEPYAWHGDSTADPAWDEFKWQSKYLLPSIAAASYHASRDSWGPLLVPDNVYFVLGDNRDDSLDSRYWGFVPFEDVIGTPRRIYWSQDPTTHAVRWGRIGHRLD